ncbi:NUDIX domain-containing protein [Caulobacter mirabilis]|uniref:DNA mismatch repair protein MutT n=1 Tax=Caulobacter mirabilis TaxID=69666 RepID=A0A2D2AWQ2_9CAUL|nr:NUDIX domain-containing protein [Caulobacter mirabilis]ATQ42377.1 DNA mismatch repair protein MutT [Caulobacter mirabilis]
MLQFGQALPGRTHVDRPAAFGIAERDGLIALVRVRPAAGGDWLDLPGGAVDPGEDEIAAVIREFGEEAGLVITVGAPIVEVSQYFVKSDGQAVNNRGSVYAVTAVGEDAGLKIEADHDLIWLDPSDAARRLRHDSHAWAVAKWLRGRAAT